MGEIDDILKQMRKKAKGIHFADLCRLCDKYFGEPRQRSSSHRIYKTPWSGDPRVNIQNSKGMAKAYQVRQVLKAIDRLKNEKNFKK